MREFGKYKLLGQIIPQGLCLTCDVCCRFPEPTSFLAPYFTGEEIAEAERLGLLRGEFSDRRGSKIALVPNGEGCRCPNFEPETHRCRIYEARPLDCRLYPFALYWDEAGTEVLLGMDTKCPFIREETHRPALIAFSEEVEGFIQSREILRLLAEHPGLVGPFQPDVIQVRPLPKVTEALRPHAPSGA